jgi:hypothetical protein
VSFAAITLCVASQRVLTFAVVYFVTDSVQKRLDTHSYFLIVLNTIQFNITFPKMLTYILLHV